MKWIVGVGIAAVLALVGSCAAYEINRPCLEYAEREGRCGGGGHMVGKVFISHPTYPCTKNVCVKRTP